MAKEFVNVSVEVVDEFCSLTRDRFVEFLDTALSKLSEQERETARFSVEAKTRWSDKYPGLYMNYKRLETDGEESLRLSREAAAVERERAEFERLSKKFGG